MRTVPSKRRKDLEGRLIATHQGLHAIHQYLLRRVYGVDDKKLRWESYPQEKLLDALMSGKADAVVLLDHFFFRGEVSDGVTCLYTDGEAWKKLHGFDELIKHMVAAREDLLQQQSWYQGNFVESVPRFVCLQRVPFGRDCRRASSPGTAAIKKRSWPRLDTLALNLPSPKRSSAGRKRRWSCSSKWDRSRARHRSRPCLRPDDDLPLKAAMPILMPFGFPLRPVCRCRSRHRYAASRQFLLDYGSGRTQPRGFNKLPVS